MTVSGHMMAEPLHLPRKASALLKRFRLFGPPGIVFFDREGREIQGLRVIGFQAADRFVAVLDQALNFR